MISYQDRYPAFAWGIFLHNLNAAKNYLENVGKGKFPLRSSKDKNKTADKYSGFKTNK